VTSPSDEGKCKVTELDNQVRNKEICQPLPTGRTFHSHFSSSGQFTTIARGQAYAQHQYQQQFSAVSQAHLFWM
jgi:hypothetical protein